MRLRVEQCRDDHRLEGGHHCRRELGERTALHRLQRRDNRQPSFPSWRTRPNRRVEDEVSVETATETALKFVAQALQTDPQHKYVEIGAALHLMHMAYVDQGVAASVERRATPCISSGGGAPAGHLQQQHIGTIVRMNDHRHSVGERAQR